MSRWRVSVEAKAGGETFSAASSTEAADLTELLDNDLPSLDDLADELEAKVKVEDVTRLQITCERLK